jgi:hypothetical protein
MNKSGTTRGNVERNRRIRETLRGLRARGINVRARTGAQAQLARHFKVSRQRIFQLVGEVERESLDAGS